MEKSQTNNAKPPDTVLLSLFFFFRIFQIFQKVIHISVLIIFFFIKSPILHDKIYSDKLRKYKLLLKCSPLPCSECNDMSVVSVLSDIRYLVRYLYMQLHVWSFMNICILLVSGQILIYAMRCRVWSDIRIYATRCRTTPEIAS